MWRGHDILGPVFLMVGLSYPPASTASLLLNLESLATMAIAWVVFAEPHKPTKR
jgi:drug/metabolite transporter (DMT)-like permease